MSQLSPHHSDEPHEAGIEAMRPFNYSHTHHQEYNSHTHQYYSQNSPYFPAAIYQPHYPHYPPPPPHHAEPIVPSDYSPGSEASNDYFYGGTSAASSTASAYHHGAANSSFSFDNDASGKSLSSSSTTSVNKKSKLASNNNNNSAVAGLHQPQGVGSNKKERRRTQSINNAFASLRDCIPNVPCDTKLSKIKTLRLATSYIDYLMQLLNSENVGSNAISGFKADIHKRWKEKSEDQKRRELEEELNNNGNTYRRMTKPCKGGARTGWPQHVWALELKQ